MASVKIILFESKTLKDGRHPVVLRVTHERKRRYFTLGEGNKSYACTTEQWNEVTGRFRKNQPDYKVLNQILLGIEKSANEIILRYDLDKETFTFDRFERTFGRIKPKDDITSVFKDEITRLEKAGRIGYSRVLQSTQRAIENFSGRTDLRLRDINYKFLIDLESSLLGKNDKKNTVSVYMRTLRTIFNTAIRYGYIKEEHYPFFSRSNPNGYSLRGLKQETTPRAISKESIRKIRDVDLNENLTLFDDRNFFMFSFYCKGLNFHDMANLKWSNIENGRLKYTRAKTGGSLDMELLEPARAIVKYYREKNTSEYVFPILSADSTDPMVIYSRIKNAMKRFNNNLKEICKKAKIEPITSYVSRHSWATIMRQEGISTDIISESMDHKSVEQTVTYLKKFDRSILDNANKSIL